MGQILVYIVEVVAGVFLIWSFWRLLSKAADDYSDRKLKQMPKYDFKHKIYHD